MKAVAIIGSPAGSIGVRASARATAANAMARSRLVTRRGQTNPRKAAGTAASSQVRLQE